MTRILGGVTLITPQSWSESYTVIDSVGTSEAGTDLVEVVRKNKYSVSASFNCTSVWYHKFMTLAQNNQLTLVTYDPVTNQNQERTVRMRDFSAEWQQYSDNVRGTIGLWVVSFTLTEF